MITQFAGRFRNASGIRADTPPSDDRVRTVASSTFAKVTREGRFVCYTYILIIDVLSGLRKEGLRPFMACQTHVRNGEKREHIKYMIRLRHADQTAGREVNGITLLNSHDGISSHQMLAGMFRSVYSNGVTRGETASDIRVRHNGDVVGGVIEGAFKVLDSFEEVTTQCEAVQALTLNQGEQTAFARAALALRYDDQDGKAMPATESQILALRRLKDRRDNMWTTSNRVQEDMMKGGLRDHNHNGRTATTHSVNGTDQSTKLNRALWVLAEETRRLKG